MNTFQMGNKKENKKLNLLFGSMAIGMLITATYLTLTQHPIANKISLWQANLLHEKNQYFPVLTICLLALPPLAILLLIKRLLLKKVDSKKIS